VRSDEELVAGLSCKASRASRGMTIWFFEDRVASAMLYIIGKAGNYLNQSSSSIP